MLELPVAGVLEFVLPWELKVFENNTGMTLAVVDMHRKHAPICAS